MSLANQSDSSGTDFCPQPIRRNRENPTRRAPLRSAHCVPGAQGWRPPDPQPARPPQRADPRSGFPRSPPPRGRAPRGGRFGEPSPGSPASAPLLCAACPGHPARQSAFLSPGRARLALSLRHRLRCHHLGPSPTTGLPRPEACS